MLWVRGARHYRPAYGRLGCHAYGQCFQLDISLVKVRGTLFGIQSGGRSESILMSLPPLVRWEYGYRPDPGSDEALLQDYLRPRDWLDETGA